MTDKTPGAGEARVGAARDGGSAASEVGPPVHSPRISVGVTCFNAESTIERALRSALEQRWPALEVIVVDDASTDGSWSVIREMAQSDERIVGVRQAENRGVACTRNAILERASGEFIAFFDDDDVSFPDRLSMQLETLLGAEQLTGNRLVACYASGSRVYDNGYEKEMPAIGSSGEPVRGSDVVDYLLFNGRRSGVFYGAGTPACALMARVSTLRRVGGFDSAQRRVEDVDMAIRLGLEGGIFVGCTDKLFRQYATTGSDKTALRNFEAELKMIDKHADYLASRNRLDYARTWFRIRYYHFSGDRLRFLGLLTRFLLRYPLAGGRHVLRSGPSRWLHERRQRAKGPVSA